MDTTRLVELVQSGRSIGEIAKVTNFGRSTIRYHLKKLGIETASRKPRFTKEELEAAVGRSSNFSEVVRTLGYRPYGETLMRVKNRVIRECIDTSHFYQRRKLPTTRKPAETVLVSGCATRTTGSMLKRALIESGESYTCADCNCEPVWNNKPLTLCVDHINGDWSDCRKENLRFLCPNCHSQTPTFGSKKFAKPNLCTCGAKISKTTKFCWTCFVKHRKVPDKFNWPDDHTLSEMVSKTPLIRVAKELGVGCTSLRKRCKKLHISYPKKGYWQKLNAEKFEECNG